MCNINVITISYTKILIKLQLKKTVIVRYIYVINFL